VKLRDLKAAAMGLRSLHRIALELKRSNDNYETLHATELERARRKPTEEKARFFYQSDRKLYEAEQLEKEQSAV
jgi:hypothetical protein